MPITLEEANREIAAFRKEFPGLSTVKIIAKATLEDFYESSVIAKIGQVRGIFLAGDREIRLPCSNNRDTQEFRETLLHEGIGHYATLTFSSSGKQELLESIVRSRQSFSLKADWDYVDQEYADKSELLKAEEIYCLAAEGVDGRLSYTDEAVAELWHEVVHDKARPLEQSDLQIFVNAVADGLARDERRQKIFPANNSIFRAEQDMPTRAEAFRNDSPEKALAKYPELKPVYKNMDRVEKMLESRFPNDENRRQHYLVKVREEIGRQLDAGKLPAPAAEKSRPTGQSQVNLER